MVTGGIARDYVLDDPASGLSASQARIASEAMKKLALTIVSPFTPSHAHFKKVPFSRLTWS